MNFKVDQQYMVHAYKYNGWLYTSVEYPYILFEDSNTLCCYLPKNKINFIKAKEKAKVATSLHLRKFFFSKNSTPMIWYFFKNKWFNVIAMFKNDKINYYINIASPYLIEENAIKYIDFDLDFKINEHKNFKIVDKNEFKVNSAKWRYSQPILKKIEEAKNEVLQLIETKWFEKLLNKDQVSELVKFVDNKFQEGQLKFDI